MATTTEQAQEQAQTYRIVRFRRSGGRKVLRRGLSFADVRLWCSRDDTRDPRGKWFDGFERE